MVDGWEDSDGLDDGSSEGVNDGAADGALDDFGFCVLELKVKEVTSLDSEGLNEGTRDSDGASDLPAAIRNLL